MMGYVGKSSDALLRDISRATVKPFSKIYHFIARLTPSSKELTTTTI